MLYAKASAGEQDRITTNRRASLGGTPCLAKTFYAIRAYLKVLLRKSQECVMSLGL